MPSEQNGQIKETLFVLNYLFKMLHVKLLTLMSDERLINMVFRRLWPEATRSYNLLYRSGQTERPPIFCVNYERNSKEGIILFL